MRLDLFIVLAGKSHISEVLAVVLVLETLTCALLELFPGQIIALARHARYCVMLWEDSGTGARGEEVFRNKNFHSQETEPRLRSSQLI